MKRGLALGAVALLLLAGCTNAKAMEGFQDATIESRNMAPTEVGNMPDGFSNYATKCDHGNRVYVLFHGDSAYGSLAVVPADPTCTDE